MRPAFSSIKSAAAFALLLLVLLLSPVLAGKKFLPPRQTEYSTQGCGMGPYPWIEHQIFVETNDIDVVFIGSSHILNGINTPYVQAQLSKKLGRPAVVLTLAWGVAGYDMLYFITRDLLTHRRVRMLVFYDENSLDDGRNNQIPFRFGEDAGLLSELPWRERALFYLSAVVGMPHNLLSLCRSTLPAPLLSERKTILEINANAPNPVTRLGSVSVGRGFALPLKGEIIPFTTFDPVTVARPADILVYSAKTSREFEFSTSPLPAWQACFSRQLAKLLHEYCVRSVMLYLPVLAEKNLSVIPERTFWPDIFQDRFEMVGIPPAKLFGGLTEGEILNLFCNSDHLNRNGQEYFTRLVTPQLLQIYESSTNN